MKFQNLSKMPVLNERACLRGSEYRAWPDQLNFGSPRWRQLLARVGFEPTSPMEIEKKVAQLVKALSKSSLEWP